MLNHKTFPYSVCWIQLDVQSKETARHIHIMDHDALLWLLTYDWCGCLYKPN